MRAERLSGEKGMLRRMVRARMLGGESEGRGLEYPGEGAGERRLIRGLAGRGGGLSWRKGGCSVFGRLVGIDTLNSVPCPNVLLKDIVPPSKSTKCLLTARPNPTPPYWRLSELSSWVKGWNIFGKKSDAIPIPVSVITKFNITSSSVVGSSIPTVIMTLPV
jgi:hypothetical protein